MYPEDDLNVQGIKPDKLNLPMSAIPSSGFLLPFFRLRWATLAFRSMFHKQTI